MVFCTRSKEKTQSRPMFQIVYSKKSLKSLERIPQKWQKKIIQLADNLKNNPYEGKKLQGELSGLYSLRIWPYRLIYLIEKKELLIIVVEIGHRQTIYK